MNKQIIKQAVSRSNLVQWIMMEIWKYMETKKLDRHAENVADRIIDRVLEDNLPKGIDINKIKYKWHCSLCGKWHRSSTNDCPKHQIPSGGTYLPSQNRQCSTTSPDCHGTTVNYKAVTEDRKVHI